MTRYLIGPTPSQVRKLWGHTSSTELLSDGKILASELAHFMHVPLYKRDGFRMLADFLSHLRANTSSDRLSAIRSLVALDTNQSDTSSSYMARVRGIGDRLQGLSLEEFLPLIAIAHMDNERYPGITARYL